MLLNSQYTNIINTLRSLDQRMSNVETGVAYFVNRFNRNSNLCDCKDPQVKDFICHVCWKTARIRAKDISENE